MAGPYTHQLLQIEGPPVLWESNPYPVPAAGAGLDFGLNIGSNKGWVAPYLKCVSPNQGYTVGDTMQLIPHFEQPVGTPGGSFTTRINPTRITGHVAQGILEPVRGGGSGVFEGNANFRVVYRGILGAGPGLYPLQGRHRGPILRGETKEFTAPVGNTFVEVQNPTDIEPMMWTLYGRCVAADGACVPGEIMAFGTHKGSGLVKGWGMSYSPGSSKFVMSGYNAVPQCVGKDGVVFIPDTTKWACFFRFIGRPKGGVYAKRPRMDKQLREDPVRLWMTPPQQVRTSVAGAFNFALPEEFSPGIVNSMYLCKTAEAGFGVGDWVPCCEGDNNSLGSGYGCTFNLNKRVMTISPFTANAQTLHNLTTGVHTALTDANWSWFYVLVG